jgi:small subunit ribosomal protein S7
MGIADDAPDVSFPEDKLPRLTVRMVARIQGFPDEWHFSGKKTIAYNILYGAIELVEKRTSENGLELWRKALNNIMPAVEVRSRRVGGSNFQVPSEVRPDRKVSLGIKWMIKYSRLRGEKTMVERLAGEIIAASKGEGAAVKKKDDTHRMAEANKAFSHFRF